MISSNQSTTCRKAKNKKKPKRKKGNKKKERQAKWRQNKAPTSESDYDPFDGPAKCDDAVLKDVIDLSAAIAGDCVSNC